MRPILTDAAESNVVDVLDNFATQYPSWAAQGFEIAGFVWWQGDKDRYDMGHATRYEQNLVNLITSLRNYYTNRYPGKVVPNAPFVLATLGQTALGDTTPATDVAILDAHACRGRSIREIPAVRRQCEDGLFPSAQRGREPRTATTTGAPGPTCWLATPSAAPCSICSKPLPDRM